MPWNGGSYAPPAPAFPAITDTPISSAYFNQIIGDIASALGNCWTRDGEISPTTNFPMGGFKLTGLGAGSSAGDSAEWSQVFQNGVFTAPKAFADPPLGDASQLFATTNWCNSLVLNSQLPGQAGNAGKFVLTNGATASWQSVILDPWVAYAMTTALRTIAFSQ